MPRDMLSDSLAVLRILENDDEDAWSGGEKSVSSGVVENINSNNAQTDFTKDDWACYYNYGLNENQNRQDDSPNHKANSLPPGCSIGQSWDQVICSALIITPEDIANQLTLLDLLCFKEIRPDELITCGWTKINKATIAPNVVAFTKRFNRVSLWTVQEILNELTAKTRAESIAHFIKVAKKLHELNNLHSLFAIISALRCASIFRLNKTWGCLSKKDKQIFDKLAELFCETDNWMMLRTYLANVSLPCIPYLGIFLTDLVYIDIAHTANSAHRATKMNVVLETLKRFQSSKYNIAPLPHVANYINSVRYIEELQKFVEDDQYKLSLKLEPPSLAGSLTGSKESMNDSTPHAGTSTPFTLSPNHRVGGSFNHHGPFNQSKFIPMHRKSRSLGSNIFGKNSTEDKSEDKTPAGSVNLLDDTLLESPGSVAEGHLTALFPPGSDASQLPRFQSFARRKTVLKNGRKSSLSSWQRFWIELRGHSLVYYSAKSFRGTTRGDFRSTHCKIMSLEGWTTEMVEGTDVFHLMNHQKATFYKFKTGCEFDALQWVCEIDDIYPKAVKPLPTNLMSFE